MKGFIWDFPYFIDLLRLKGFQYLCSRHTLPIFEMHSVGKTSLNTSKLEINPMCNLKYTFYTV